MVSEKYKILFGYPRSLFLKRLNSFCIILILTVSSPLLATISWAAVGDECSDCHTMHDSQTPTPENPLLTSDCVGCHSSDTNETIVNLTDSRVPIVFNLSGYPSQPLAGGNFYNVSLGGSVNDLYGHNVWGISAADNMLTTAPGSTISCANSCHDSLAIDPELVEGLYPFQGAGGCQGCHMSYNHHGTDPPPGQLETAESGWYRFLSGHYANMTVYGVEDPDWEQIPTSGHNKYQGYANYYFNQPGYGLDIAHSITAFCSGCHADFHSAMTYFPGVPGSMMSPWLRHPADVAYPTNGEFAAYDPVTDYDTQVPVAWLDPTTPANGEAVVMCLSCHRAHGSEYPDMLRWDYSEMIVGATDVGQGKGCFVCHSQKDG